MKNKKKIPKVPLIVSTYDIDYVLEKGNTGLTFSSLYGEFSGDGISDELIEILYSIGMAVEHDMEIQEVLHRPRWSPNNMPWKGRRLFGWEREDEEWLNSGRASLEVRIRKYAEKDSSQYAELKRMSAESNFTAEYIESLKRNKKET